MDIQGCCLYIIQASSLAPVKARDIISSVQQTRSTPVFLASRKNGLKPPPRTASGEKDFYDLGFFDFNDYIGDLHPQTRYSREQLFASKPCILCIDERLQLGYNVMVACHQGALRSFTIVGQFLMVTTKMKNAGQINTTKNKQ